MRRRPEHGTVASFKKRNRDADISEAETRGEKGYARRKKSPIQKGDGMRKENCAKKALRFSWGEGSRNS